MGGLGALGALGAPGTLGAPGARGGFGAPGAPRETPRVPAVAPHSGQVSSRGLTSAPQFGHCIVAEGGLKHMGILHNSKHSIGQNSKIRGSFPNDI